MSRLPIRTVTFLFADIEGSARLLQDAAERYAEILTDYHHLLHTASQTVVDTRLIPREMPSSSPSLARCGHQTGRVHCTELEEE